MPGYHTDVSAVSRREVDTVDCVCQTVTYDSKVNARGVRCEIEVDRNPYLRPEEKQKGGPALIVRKHFEVDDVFIMARWEIYSKHLQRAFHEVIGNKYPEVSWTGSFIKLKDPPHCIYHELRKFEQYQHDIRHKSPEAYEHLELLLNLVRRKFENGMRLYEDHLNNVSRAEASLDFDNLWFVFRPKILLFQQIGDVPVISQLERFERCSCNRLGCERHSWTLSILNWTLVGHRYRRCRTLQKIARFDGFKQINKLSIYPLMYHPDEQQVLAHVVKRGKDFLRLDGVHHKQYSGLAWELEPSADGSPATHHVDGRIIIDTKGYSESIPSKAPVPGNVPDGPVLDYRPLRNTRPSEDGKSLLASLDEDQLAICHYRVPGFSLKLKTWFFFFVDNIQDITFEPRLFASLDLPESEKSILRMLAQSHALNSDTAADIDESDKNGFVVLLHGPPGTGKSATAESIAEVSERPVYEIAISDLDTYPKEFAAGLTKALTRAERWNAIVLVDEVDVFLTQRGQRSIECDAIVSAFLHRIQRFKGLMILTTNRASSLDQAVWSRIHFHVEYKELDGSQRESLWRELIDQMLPASDRRWFNDCTVANLAQYPLDASQIEKCLKVARALGPASKDGKGLTFSSLQNIVRMAERPWAMLEGAKPSARLQRRTVVTDESDGMDPLMSEGILALGDTTMSGASQPSSRKHSRSDSRGSTTVRISKKVRGESGS